MKELLCLNTCFDGVRLYNAGEMYIIDEESDIAKRYFQWKTERQLKDEAHERSVNANRLIKRKK